jgi:hypothetical protein
MRKTKVRPPIPGMPRCPQSGAGQRISVLSTAGFGFETAGNLANVGFNGFKGWLSVSVFFLMEAGGSDLTTELVGGDPAIRENLFLSVNHLTPVYRLLN